VARRFQDPPDLHRVLLLRSDSVIFIQNVDEPQKVRTGDYMCHLTDELEEIGSGSVIQEFVTLKLLHPFILLVAGPNICGNSTYVIILMECRK